MRHGHIQLVPMLVNSIFEPERKRLAKTKADFVFRNMELGGTRFGFTFMGQRFSDYSNRHMDKKGLQAPAPELIQDIKFYLSDLKKMEHDSKKLSQSLSVVLPRCRSSQDIRDVLPEVFTIDIPELSRLHRQRAEGFLLQEYPMLYDQYQIMIKIAEYYTINKLVY